MILIADDNPQVRRMIRSLLEEIDADVAECSDGGAAIEAYDELKPDWLLMDINMLPVDGLTATRTILEKHPEARIIVISQYQDARTRDTALAMGAYAFVGKDDLTSIRTLIEDKLFELKKVASDP